MTQEHTIEIPAPVEELEVIEVEAPKKAKKSKPKGEAKAPKATSSTITPKQLAKQLNTTPQKVRRHLRTIYGVQHEEWKLNAKQVEAVKKAMGSKAK